MPSPATTQNCANSTDTYTFFALKGGDTFSVVHPGVVGNVFYYQVRIIYGIITLDEFPTTLTITTTFTSNLSSTAQTVQLGSNNQTKICGDPSKFERYRTVNHVWTYSDPTSLDFTITTD